MKDYHYLSILPNNFKVVGLLVVIAATIALFVLDLNLLIIKALLSLFILGLLLFVLAKEKCEDEMIVRARYVSVIHALVVGVFIAIMAPPLLHWVKSPVSLGYQEFALTILGIYIVNFYWFLIQARYEK